MPIDEKRLQDSRIEATMSIITGLHERFIAPLQLSEHSKIIIALRIIKDPREFLMFTSLTAGHYERGVPARKFDAAGFFV
jgi:hypothetical protein